jgi:hypothetical protein
MSFHVFIQSSTCRQPREREATPARAQALANMAVELQEGREIRRKWLVI